MGSKILEFTHDIALVFLEKSEEHPIVQELWFTGEMREELKSEVGLPMA